MFEGQLFELGEVVTTRDIAAQLRPAVIVGLVKKHATGDFGDLCQEDIDENTRSIREGDRVLSMYNVPVDGHDEKIYVITEWDRSVTTVLFADEY